MKTIRFLLLIISYLFTVLFFLNWQDPLYFISYGGVVLFTTILNFFVHRKIRKIQKTQLQEFAIV